LPLPAGLTLAPRLKQLQRDLSQLRQQEQQLKDDIAALVAR
jgi:uncharacterized protein YdcH (DUF465 family)